MSKAKILVVEDEGITALNIKGLLENWGYENPSIALNSKETFQNVSKSGPDLILMDINLNEDIDGVDIVNQLKKDYDIPIIYLTAHSNEITLERAKLTEPYGYIVKPFNNEELKIAVDTAIYRHGMEKKLKKMNELLEIELEKRKKAEKELKKSKDSLEEKVRRRTEELQMANEILKQEINVRNDVEQKLIKSKEKYRAIFENAANVITSIDKNGMIVNCNLRIKEFLGYTPDEVIGQPLFKIIHPDCTQKAHKYLEAIIIKGYFYNQKYKMVKKDGSSMDVNVNSAAVKDDNGNFLHTICIIEDVTQRKIAEDGKKREQQKFMDIIEFLPDATFVIDQDGNVIAWNRAIEKMTGLPKEKILGKGNYDYSLPFYGYKRPILIDLILSQDNEVKPFYDHVGREGDTLYGDVFIPNTSENSGKFIWGKASPFYDDKGNFLGAIESIRDISKRKKMEEQLKESKEQLEIAMDLAKLVHWEYDVASDLFTFDDHFYKLYCTSTSLEGGSKMSSGEYARKFIPPGESSVVAEEIAKALETDDFNYSGQLEHSIIRADGEKCFIIVRYGIIKDDKGDTIKIYGTNQDITERKKSEEEMKKLIRELKRSNDELQQFAYITSHDLQEPLRTIASFTQLLERRYKNKLDRDADEFIDYIVEASIRMKQMILDLLEYSRVTRTEKFKPLKSEEVLINVLDSLHLLIEESNAEVTYESLPEVVADESQLFRVFQNLIENAIKFKKEDENPEVHISACSDEENHEYIFSVFDNGIGIEDQYFNRIFMLFQRLHTRAEYGGTGIGLSISKRIIENHGGKIWVESEPNEGSTFYFTILKK